MAHIRRNRDPAQSVLGFLSDLLSTSNADLATQFLGVQPSTTFSTGNLLPSILSHLSEIRSAKTNPAVYSECLHSLTEIVMHPSCIKVLDRAIMEDEETCRDLFDAVIAANAAFYEIKEELESKEKIIGYKADIFLILAKTLPSVRRESDLHRNVLEKIFQSFFSTSGIPTIEEEIKWNSLDDPEAYSKLSLLYEGLSLFVRAAMINHWQFYKQNEPKAFGFLCNTIFRCLHAALRNLQRPEHHRVSESLCLVVRDTVTKLCDEAVQDSSDSMDEMLQNLPLLELCLGLYFGLDIRMTEKLRTHGFGVMHGLLCFGLRLHSSSTYKSQIQRSVLLNMSKMSAVLNGHLRDSQESKEIHVLLFELMSLLFEYCDEGTLSPNPDTFLNFIQESMSGLVVRMTSIVDPQAHDQSLLNAQLIFLSKVATKSGSDFFSKKALDLVKDSRVFGLLIKEGHFLQPQELDRVRPESATVTNTGVIEIFMQHFDEFKTALIQGSQQKFLNQEWNPCPSDIEVARLVEGMILNSQIKTEPHLFYLVSDYCPSLKQPNQQRM